MFDAAPTADLTPQSRSGRLLSLVRKLWDYGLQISASLDQHPPKTAGDKAYLTRTFGFSNVMAILVRIALGMKRARFLAERITRAAAQIDAGSQPEPLPPRAPRASPVAMPRMPNPYPEPRPTDETIVLISRLPTVSQIARKILRQPIGDVLADICRDLGISDDHPLWDELHAAITEFGGTLVRRVKSKLRQVVHTLRITDPPHAEPGAEPEPASTGPPLPAAT
jgi:hypothetical protein